MEHVSFSRILVPHEIVNDAEVTLVAFRARAGDLVQGGQIVAEIETSKSVIEVEAPSGGHFQPLAGLGAKLAIGATLGVVSGNPRFDVGSLAAARPAATVDEPIITEPARQLLAQHEIDPSVFAGLPLVRKCHVEAYLACQPGMTSEGEECLEEPIFFHKDFASSHAADDKIDVLIIGAGGHSSVIIDILHRDPTINLLGLADSDPALLDRTISGNYQVVALQAEVRDHFDPARVALFIALGSNPTRLEVAESFASLGYQFVNAIDRTAKIALGARLGTGIAVMPQAVVGARAAVGDHVIINTKASIDHDCVVSGAAHVAPGATLGGSVRVGARSLIGIGCSINQGIRIGKDVSVSSGFTLYRDVPDGKALTAKIGRTWW
jgi:sugar O-acyltransferase (sialic acid O-acetyltransferase NeuD family)